MSKCAAEHTILHYALRKLSVGLVTVLLGTTIGLGMNSSNAKASEDVSNTNQDTDQVSNNVGSDLKAQEVSLQSNSDRVAQGKNNFAGSSAEKQTSSTTQPATNGVATNDQHQQTSRSQVLQVNQSRNNNNNPAIYNQVLAKQPSNEVPESKLGSVRFYNYTGMIGTVSPIKYHRDSATGQLDQINLSSVSDQIAQNYATANTIPVDNVKVVYFDNNNHVVTTVDPNDLADQRRDTPIYCYVYDSTESTDLPYSEAAKTQQELDMHPLNSTPQTFTFDGTKGSGDYNNVSYLTPAEGMTVVGNQSSYENTVNKDLPHSYWKQLKDLGTVTYKDDDGNTVTQYLAANPNPDGSYNMYNGWLPISDEGTVEPSQVQDMIKLLTGGPHNYHFDTADDFSNSELGQFIHNGTFLKLYDTQADLDADYNDFFTNYPNTYEDVFEDNGGTASGIIYLPEYGQDGKVIADKYSGAIFLYQNGMNKFVGQSISLDPTYDGPYASGYIYMAGGSSNGITGFLRLPVDQQKQNITYTIVDDTAQTTLVPKTQLATGRSNHQLPASVTTNYAQIRQNWLKKGYALDTTKADGRGYDQLPTTFDDDSKTDQNVTIYLVHTYAPVDEQHPQKGVKPSEYTKPVTETVHYVGAGNQTPKDHVQTSKWTRTLTVDQVTGKLVKNGKYDTDWSIPAGSMKSYAEVDTPAVTGYTAD